MPEYQSYELSGSRGTYLVQAIVAEEQDGRTTLSLSDGRTLVVPSSAVKRGFEAIPGPRTTQKPAPPSGARGFAALLESLKDGADAWDSRVPSFEDDRNTTDPAITQRAEWLRPTLDEVAQTSLNKEDALLVRQVDRVCELLIARLIEPEFEAAKDLRSSYNAALQVVLKQNSPGSSLAKVLRRLVNQLREAETADWRGFTERFTARPHIAAPEATIPLEVGVNGEVLLPIKVVLGQALAPATNIRVVIESRGRIEPVGQLPTIDRLQPGESKNVRVRLIDRRRQGASDEVRLRAHLNYVGPNNETLSSVNQKFTLELRKQSVFEEIPNPFHDYASGVPVDDPRMFFGREALIGDIVAHLTQRPVGRCYGLYGQKRTGKSSLSGQVRVAINDTNALVCTLSMGTIDRNEITQSFIVEVLDQLREQLANRLSPATFTNLLTRWPSRKELSASPMAAFRRAVNASRALLREDGKAEPRVILVVDEFTYLYELLRREHVSDSDQHQLRDFMRQWKGWLEAKLFSALVIGQDTMPAFIQAFPNEFSVMHTERLDYLSEHETTSLADRPIQKADGTSRFAGFALATIHQYTGGHPYFTQILCDRVVTVANEQRRSDITDVEVDTAVETLLSGSREIGNHRFDCLLSADNTGILLDQTAEEGLTSTPESARRVLQRIAMVAGPQNNPVEREHLQLSTAEQLVFDDLCSRGVLTSHAGRYRIRVMLFSEYARRSGT